MEKLKKRIEASGNTYLPESEVLRYHEDVEGLPMRYINGKKMYTLPYILQMERSIAKNIIPIIPHARRKIPQLPKETIDSLLDRFEDNSEAIMGFRCSLHEEQRNAVYMAVNSHVGVITGGPGTGKTTVINAVIYVEKHREDKESPFICFTAPTGKAARRISEATGYDAHTVQKEIGANDFADTPKEVSCDIFIVDEASMLDTVTMYQLMRSIDEKSKLLLLGDVDQLPSVGMGAVLRDLIDSMAIPVVKLEKTFRQKGGSALATNILYLRKGYEKLEKGKDFSIIHNFEDDEIVERLIQTIMEKREVYGGKGVVLLTPYRRKGASCSNKMNILLQERLNNSSVKVEADVIDTDEETGEDYTIHMTFKVGDPVMQLKNLETESVANGDVGEITRIYTDGAIEVDFGHYEKTYTTIELNQLSLAYAMSIHKSQGSEYPCVVTCALAEHKQLLNRNMVYTAVTRAKKECVFFAKDEVLHNALLIEGGYIRTTRLCEEIQYEDKKARLIESAL